VTFAWLDDANPYNNLGQENTQVGVAHSPVTFQFRLANPARVTQDFRFETDTYAIPQLPPCNDGPEKSRGQQPARRGPWTPAEIPPRHNRRNYPLPQGWNLAFAPANPRLAAGEEITVAVTVNAPSGFHGRQPINVHAFAEAGLAGGVTLYVDGS